MKLVKQPIEEFAAQVASDSATPGGGSVAALCGAMGASLAHMVSALTVSKEKYSADHARNAEIIKEAEAMQTALLSLIDRDSEAFSAMMQAMKMPRSSEEEKSRRKEKMQIAIRQCAIVPLETMGRCAEGLALCEKALGHSNPNAASDLGVSALSLKAGLQGAWLNVLINLPGIDDPAAQKEYREQGEAFLEKGIRLADRIYSEILHSLKG